MNSKFDIGKVLCDMHDGLKLPENATCIERISVRAPGGTEFIERCVIEETMDETYRYTNKTLVVVDEWSDKRGSGVIAAFSFDGRRVGLLRIKVTASMEEDLEQLCIIYKRLRKANCLSDFIVGSLDIAEDEL